MYSKKVIEHFIRPRNIGEIPDPDGVGIAENPLSGDLIEIFLRIKGSTVVDGKYKCFGCPVLVATGDHVIELVKGKDLKSSAGLSSEALARSLGGLPSSKLHCASLAIDALKFAVSDYGTKGVERRRGEKVLSDWRRKLAPKHAHVHLPAMR